MNRNNSPYIIVITGGIATGKSEASKYLREQGYTVLDCDEIVHDGYNIKTDLYEVLVGTFGNKILDDNMCIDRQRLGEIVLSNNELLVKLNFIVHKYVVDKLIGGVKKSKAHMIFLDIPLFFEQREALKEMGLKYDEVWLIYVSQKTQTERLVQRAKLENKDVKQVLSIITKQISIEDKKLWADRVINNEGTVEELRKKILKMINGNL